MAEKLSLFLFHDLRFAIYDFRKSQIANRKPKCTISTENFLKTRPSSWAS